MELNRRRASARADALVVVLATTVAFCLSSVFELQERLAASALRFEAWQLDEAPTALTALSLGLAWFAWRRRAETARLLAHNRELAQQLIAVQENERLAIARELHDDLAQHCTAIRVEAACIERARDGTQVLAAARRVADAAEGLHVSVRRMLRRLRPAELDELGLVAALESLCAAFEARTGVRCTLAHAGRLDHLGEAYDTAVYRVAQEALANVARHADARRVTLDLRAEPARLSLRIVDDGRGFEVGLATCGLGLLGARERAAAFGGWLHASSAPGAGASLCMILPLAAEASA